jgi:site-specific DNA-methyltransferase (adenine-specific)
MVAMALTPYYQDAAVTIYHGDCRNVLPLPASHIITDPPYEIADGSAFVRNGGATIADGSGLWNSGTSPEEWLTLAYNSLGECGYVASFHDMRKVDEFWQALRVAGFRPWSKFYLVKPNPPACPRRAFQSGIEECTIALKGDRREWYGGGATLNYWYGTAATRNGHGHPAEKPIEAIFQLMQALSTEAEIILDPFMGSGTTLRAAKDLGRRAIGIEIEERYCEIAAKRMAQEVLPL